jgi:hypothetical protein
VRERVDEVVLLPYDVFGDAYVDTLVCAVTKRAAGAGHRVLTCAYPKRAKLETIAPRYERVAQATWTRAPDCKFVLDARGGDLAERVRAACPRMLGDVLAMKRGVLAAAGSFEARPSSPASFPYFEGDVHRYALRFASTKWVRWDADLVERPREFAWFEGERVLLRRLVNRQGRLMAAVAEETFVTNKNLYSLRPRANDGDVNAWALAALLNARLLSYLYATEVTQAVKDDFPQVTIRDVLALPAPAEDALRAAAPELARHAKAVAQLTLRGRREDAALADAEIDARVHALYGLDVKDVALVEGRARRS